MFSKDSLADGQEVTIETPNYPENYPNKAKCNWKIKVPAGEEVHIWCESFDVLKGDFLRIKGVTSKVYGSYEEGIGEILPATNKAKWLKIQFRSNKRKNAGGFRCQFAAVAPFTGTGSGSGSSTGSGSGSTTGTGSGAGCLTNSVPASGSPCVFPFNYMGVSHFGCTTIDGDTTPWCSTQTDANNDHVSGVGAWGYCDASCPVQETGSGSGSTTGSGSGTTCMATSGPAEGSACVFPFIFMGVSHFGCTTIDGDTTPWCSTQTDAEDNHVSGVGAWGYCDASCP